MINSQTKLLCAKAKNLLFCLLLLLSFIVASAQPRIDSFTPLSGSVGTTITIVGFGFSATANNNIVYFGPVRGVVTEATATSLTVTVPTGAACLPITITTGNLTAWSDRAFIPTFNPGYFGEVADRSFPQSFAVDTLPDANANGDARGMAVGDFDGDGKPDVAVVDRTFTTLSVYRNSTKGDSITFDAKQDYATGNWPISVQAGDLDGDGKLDLVVANSKIDDNSVSIYLNKSSSGHVLFAAPLVVAAGGQPMAVFISDLDLDGKADIAVANIDLPGAISVLRNTSSPGALAFAPKQTLPVTGSFNDVAASDLDGDKKPDLIFTDIVQNGVVILRNNSTKGNIAFGAAKFVATGTFPSGIATGDLTNDGKLDLVVANAFSNTVSVLVNNSTAGVIAFKAKRDIDGLASASDVAISDVNGDARPDLLVVDANDANVYAASVLMNLYYEGYLNFSSPVNFPVLGSSEIMAADFDTDGRQDMIVSGSVLRGVIYANRIGAPNVSSFSPSTAGEGTVVTIKGQNFTGVTAVRFGGTPAASFTVVDDYTINAVVGPGNSGSLVVTSPRGRSEAIGFTFTSQPVITSFAPAVATSGTTITINGANLSKAKGVRFGGTRAASFKIISPAVITAIVGNGASGDVSVIFSTDTISAPGFVFPSGPVVSGFTPVSGRAGTVITIAGTNFHPIADSNIVYFGAVRGKVISGTSSSLSVEVPAGATYQPISVTAHQLTTFSSLPFTPTFVSTTTLSANAYSSKEDFRVNASSYAIGTGDWNNDGKVDLATTSLNEKSVSVFQNKAKWGTIQFNDVFDSLLRGNAEGITAADMDGDGIQDMIVMNILATVYKSTPSGGNIAFAPKTDIDILGGYHSAVADFNFDGKPDLVTGGFGRFNVLQNTSSGNTISFGAPMVYTTDTKEIRRAAIGDFDSDGKPDFAVVNTESNTVSVFRNTSTQAGIAFESPVSFETGSRPWDIASGDINGDGKMDLVTVNFNSNTVSVFLNNESNGIISFSKSGELGTGANPRSVALGDLNGDGRPELIVVNAVSNSISVFENKSVNGVANFNRFDIGTNGFPIYATVADFDNDGKPDIASITYPGIVSLYRNQLGEQMTNVCIGTTASLTANINGASYQWQINNGKGFENISDNSIYTGTSSSTLEIKNIDSSYAGLQYRCTSGAISSTVFTLVPRPIPPVPVITVVDTILFCDGGSVHLRSSAETGNTWYWNGTPIADYDLQEFVVASPGGQFALSATVNGCTSALSAPVTLTPTPNVVPTIAISYSGCNTGSLLFSSSVTAAGTAGKIDWYVNNAYSGTGPTFTLKNAAKGIEVYAELTSSYQCVLQTVVKSATKTVDCTTTAVSTIDALNSFLLSPNPTAGLLTVQLKLQQRKKVFFRVVNANGFVVYEGDSFYASGNTTKQIDLRGKAQGLYYLQTTIGDKQFIEKIVLTR